MLAIIRDIVNVMRAIRTHPLYTTGAERRYALRRFLAWQIAGRAHSGGLCMEYVDGARLLVRRRLGGRLHYILGLGEFDDMAFVAHVLRKGEIFVDVGANIGAYTVLAGVTSGARCVSFEPTEHAARYLIDNVMLNGLVSQVEVCRCAVGAAHGELQLTTGMGEVNHVLHGGESVQSMRVEVITLDDFFEKRESPCVVKIDVEGFETEVMRGAQKLLARRAPLAFLIELAGHGAAYGYDESVVRMALEDHGYICCHYAARQRKLFRIASDEGRTASPNMLFVRDLDEARRRLEKAPPFSLGNYKI